MGGESTASELLNLSEIKVGREGIVRSFKFNKLTLTKGLFWELILDMFEDLDSVNMSYQCTFVADPEQHNSNLKSVISEFKSPQKSMDSDEKFLERAKKIHADYKKLNDLINGIDFIADVMKYESKAKTNQIKLIVKKEVAEFITSHMNDLIDKEGKSRFAIVFLNQQ